MFCWSCTFRIFSLLFSSNRFLILVRQTNNGVFSYPRICSQIHQSYTYSSLLSVVSRQETDPHCQEYWFSTRKTPSIGTYFLYTSEVFSTDNKVCEKNSHSSHTQVQEGSSCARPVLRVLLKQNPSLSFPRVNSHRHTDAELISLAIQPILLRSKVTVSKSCQFKPSSVPLR